jgi:hypothetical protein
MFDRPGVARNRVLQHETVSNEQAPSQVVTNMVPMEMFAVRYGDASGKAHNTIAFRSGGVWYLDSKNNRGEVWAKELTPASGWLAKQLDSVLESKTAPMPEKLDPVGILGDE